MLSPESSTAIKSSGSTKNVASDEVSVVENGGVTWRAVVLSLLCAAIFGYVIPIADYRFNNTFIGAAHMPPGAIAVLLFILLLLNPILRLFSKRALLTRNETLTVFITALFSCLVPGRGGDNFWVPNVLASFYYATRENKWLNFLLPYVKPWMTPALHSENGKSVVNQSVVDGWYSGGVETVPWAAWTMPLIAWSAVILAIYVLHGCLAVLLRAQWAEREALAFPLLRLPMQMTEDADDRGRVVGAFFRNPTMWVGFLIAVFIEGMNGLSFYFPDVPIVPLDINSGPMFTEPPWNQMGGLSFKVWPLVLGVSYLLTAEVGFSLWAFFWLNKLQLIGAYYLGFPSGTIPSPTWTRGMTKGFLAYQQFGAYFAYVAILLWTAREHFRHILRRAFRLDRARPEEAKEALSYPVAFWGFVLAFAFIIAWTIAAGVRWDIALVLWITYLVLSIGLARLVVEAGLIFVHTGWSPVGPLSYLFGSSWMTPASAVPASFIGGALMTELRGFLLPSFIQSFKLADDRGISQRRLWWLIFACILVSMAIGIWNNVHLGYTYGGLTMQEWWARGNGAQAPAKNAKELVGTLEDNWTLNWGATGVGAVLTWLMMLARSRFSWFPLHPIGYVMFTPFAIQTMWFSIFLGWSVKVTVTRYGGSETYRKLTPAMLGLILGEVVMMLLWLAIDGWQGRSNHQLMPG